MELIRIEEIVNAVHNEAVVNIVIPPGTQITATGANAAGPVISQGVTTGMAVGDGIIR